MKKRPRRFEKTELKIHKNRGTLAVTANSRVFGLRVEGADDSEGTSSQQGASSSRVMALSLSDSGRNPPGSESRACAGRGPRRGHPDGPAALDSADGRHHEPEPPFRRAVTANKEQEHREQHSVILVRVAVLLCCVVPAPSQLSGELLAKREPAAASAMYLRSKTGAK